TLDGESAVEVMGASNLAIYGGDITDLIGHGVIVRGDSGIPTSNVSWYGFTIHDTAGQGLLVHQNTGDVTGVDMRGDIKRWSRNLAYDPHNPDGSGIHGAYIGVTSSTSYRVSDSTFVLHVSDSEYGAGVQLGPGLTNVEVQVRAENLTY